MAAKISKSKSAYDFDMDLEKMLYRPRMNALLEKGLSYPMTLIWAPAGYGKTTAAMQFAKNSDCEVIFMSLSELDRNPQRFWAHMSDLYRKINQDIGDAMAQIGFPFSSAQFEQQYDIVSQNMISRNKRLLIIDDYHLLGNPEIDKLLEKIARLRIKNLHIYILSRVCLQNFMLDLRIKRIAMEITKEELRFDINELMEYYKMLDINIEKASAQNIESFTDGWASAIFLSSLYIKKDNIADMNLDAAALDINNLIETTIFNNYSKKTQELLLKLSILERFDIDICNYIAGTNHTQKLLSNIFANNSLIKISEDRQHYEMHRLFRDFLYERLQTSKEFNINDLNNQAGEYYAFKGDVVIALSHFDAASNYEGIAEMLLKDKFSDTFSLQQLETIVSYLQKLPQEYYIKYPMLLVISAFLMTRSKHPEKAIELIKKVEHICKNTQIPEAMKNKLLGEAAVVKSMMAFNDVFAMLPYHMEACKFLPQGSELLSKNISFTFGSPSMLYLYYNKAGNLDNIVKGFTEEFFWWEKITPCGYGADILIKAEAEFERCEYEEAEQDAYRTIYKAEQKEQNSIIIAAKLLLIKLCMVEGNYGKAAVILQDIRNIVNLRKALVYSTTLDMCIGFFNVITGDLERIPKWLYSGELDKSSVSMTAFGFEYLIYTAVLLFKGNYLKIESIIPKMFETFTPFTYQYGIMRTYILKAIVNFNLYGIEATIEAINAAYNITNADRIIMPYLEYGEFLLPIFKQLSKNYGSFELALPKEWIDTVIKKQKEFQKALQKFKAGYNAMNPDRAEKPVKLTKREREILYLIAKGYTGEDIAKELFVTINNVKVITSKIYRKIGVSSRTGAVKFAIDNRMTD